MPINQGFGYQQPTYGGAGVTYYPPSGIPYPSNSGSGTKKKVFAALGVAVMLLAVAVRLLVAVPGTLFRDPSSAALRGDPTGEKTLPITYLKFPGAATTDAAIRDNLKTYMESDPMYGGEELIKHFFGNSSGAADQYVSGVHYDRKSGDVLIHVKYPFQMAPALTPDAGSNGYDPYAYERVASASQREYIEYHLQDPSRLISGEEFRTKHWRNVPDAWRSRMQSSIIPPTNYLLATPVSNLKFSASGRVSIPYRAKVRGLEMDFTYVFSIAELADLMADNKTYGGAMRILDEDLAKRQINVVANHGAFVAKPDEPSLTRLVKRITGDYAMSREEKIQSLLNVAASCVAYDTKESQSRGEILKRPNETLISRRGDCSSKTILLASLLEQLREDYLLVYYKDHINVAVAAGNFRVTNGLSFDWEGKSWVIAETTVADFLIGETMIEQQGAVPGVAYRHLMNEIELVQRPNETGVVYDYRSKKKVRLL